MLCHYCVTDFFTTIVMPDSMVDALPLKGIVSFFLTDTLPLLLLEGHLVWPGWVLRHRGSSTPRGLELRCYFLSHATFCQVLRLWVYLSMYHCYLAFLYFAALCFWVTCVFLF